jgi:hypothetical protein
MEEATFLLNLELQTLAAAAVVSMATLSPVEKVEVLEW